MVRLSKFVSLWLGLCLCLALSMSAGAATLSQNGKGDLLLYPVYIAGDGVKTTFHVVNTDTNSSVVAKVVLRSGKYSQEVLDFLIYLSPNDKFSATISYEDGKYVLTSTDDSFCASDGTCASELNPFKFTLKEPCEGLTNDYAGLGYIEVISAGSVDLPKESDGTVNKSDIVKEYWNNWQNFKTGGDIVDSLTGYAEVVLPGPDYSGYQAVAIANYGNNNQLTVSSETKLGDGAITALGDINQSGSLENILAKNNLVVPVSKEAVAIPVVTFPTKLSSCPYLVNGQSTVDNLGPFFAGGDDNTTYTISYYDMSEHSTIEQNPIVSPVPKEAPNTLPDELNLLIVDYPFTNSGGWFKINFKKDVPGAPLVGVVAEFTENGFSFIPYAYDVPQP